METQRPIVIAQGEENGRIKDAGMDGAWEAGNEVMITIIKKHHPQACSLKPHSGGGLAHGAGRTQWVQPDMKQGGGELGGARQAHTSWPWRDPESPGDTWDSGAWETTADTGQELGKRGVCKPHGSICRIRLGIWYEEPPCTGPRTSILSGNPHPQASLPKAENL